jgi:hypothetical protein
MKKDNFPVLPEVMMDFMPPMLRPINPNAGLLGLTLQKWTTGTMAQIAKNQAEIAEFSLRRLQATVGHMFAIQTYGSNVETALAENKHKQMMWQLEEAKAHAEARSAKASADRDELDLEQFRKAMSEGA